MRLADAFCTIYYVLSTFQSIPCIWKIIKTKSSSDFSLLNQWMWFISVICWSMYVYLTEQSLIVYIGTTWDLMTVTTQVIVVMKYYKRRDNKDKLN